MHGAPTTARATKHLFEDNDARPTTSAIRSGGILEIAHPTFAKGIRRSSHSCSGRLLAIQHEHMAHIAVYGIASASSSPERINNATEGQPLSVCGRGTRQRGGGPCTLLRALVCGRRLASY